MTLLRKTNEESERQVVTNEAKIKNLEKELQVVRQENDEMRQKMIEAHKNVCSLTESSSGAEKENSRMKQELTQLQKKVFELEKDCREHLSKCEKLIEDNKSLNDEILNSRKKRDETDNDLKSSRQEAEELQAKVKELQGLETHTICVTYLLAHYKVFVFVLKGLMKSEESRGNTMKNDLEDLQRKADEAQKNFENSSKQNQTLELENIELKQQLTNMKYQIESLEIEKKDKYQLQEKLTAAEQKYKELLKRNEKEQGEFSSVENLNETLKEENLQLHVDLGREKDEKSNLEIKVDHGLSTHCVQVIVKLSFSA